jgi:hypothetical protein
MARTVTKIPVSDTAGLCVTCCISCRKTVATSGEKDPETMKGGLMEPVYAVQMERQAEEIATDDAFNVEGLLGAGMGHFIPPSLHAIVC